MEENQETAFIGIDPSDTIVIKYGNGEFTLGVLPAGMWDRVNTRMIIALTNARRECIRDLAAKGLDPEEVVGQSTKLTRLDIEVQCQDELKKNVATIHIEALRYGLRAHERFKTKKGTVPYEATEQVVDGVPVPVVSEKTLRYYRTNPAVSQALWIGFRQLHDLDETAKKA